MDGIETLTEARKLYKDLPIIMYGTLTERGGSKTLETLPLGATDYFTKPANVNIVSTAKQPIREQLIPKIKMFCGGKAGTATLFAEIRKLVEQTTVPVINK